MTHARESYPKTMLQQGAMAIFALGITLRTIAASVVFAMVYGPPEEDRETAISTAILGPSFKSGPWNALDELQSGLLGISVVVFYGELHVFTAADQRLIVSYLLLNVGVIVAPAILQISQEVAYSLKNKLEIKTQS